jgi:hypothetical protein
VNLEAKKILGQGSFGKFNVERNFNSSILKTFS